MLLEEPGLDPVPAGGAEPPMFLRLAVGSAEPLTQLPPPQDDPQQLPVLALRVPQLPAAGRAFIPQLPMERMAARRIPQDIPLGST